MKEIIGDKVRIYKVITCPYCKEAYRIDWKEIAKTLGQFPDEDPEDFHLICPWCEEETPKNIWEDATAYQIVKED